MDALNRADKTKIRRPRRLNLRTVKVAQSRWNSIASNPESTNQADWCRWNYDAAAKANEEPASFVVARSADNLHILSEARLGTETQRGRLLPVRNRSHAQLLSREMEILCNDQIYQEAVTVAAKMIDHLK